MWLHDYQDLAPGHKFWCYNVYQDTFPILFCPNSPDPPPEVLEPEPPITDMLSQDETAGVIDRKLVDSDGTLLEWAEYFGKGDGGLIAGARMLNRWGLPFDFSNRTGAPYSLPGLDERYFFMGYNQTTVRRHLVADNTSTADNDVLDLEIAAYQVDVPVARFDDTIHIFSNGRVIYSSEDYCVGKRIDQGGNYVCSETNRTHADHFGTIPLDGRLLEVRRYRGSAENGGTDRFQWFTGTGPQPVQVEQYRYTWDPEDGSTLEGSGPYTFDIHSSFCRADQPWDLGVHRTDDDLLPFCAARSESLRTRRVVVEDLYDDTVESGSFFSGSESWYETDTSIPGSPSLGSYKYQWNQVLGRTLESFLTAAPTTDDWTYGTLKTTTAYEEAPVNAGMWLTSLPAGQTATPASGTSTKRTTFSYSAGILQSKTDFAASSGTDDNDLTTSYTYWKSPYTFSSESYGQVRTVDLKKRWAPGADDATGFEYDQQVVKKTWKLCRYTQTVEEDGRGPVARCPGWQDRTAVFDNPDPSLKEELLAEQTIDQTWRWPTTVKDANGDGVGHIGYDILGRVRHLVPTHVDKAETWLD